MKICVMGDGGVGKTALTIQLVSNCFVEDYDPTIEDSYRKQVRVDDASYLLEILDTAGQEEFTALRDQWIRECEGYILVFSITSRSSFEHVLKFRTLILRVLDVEYMPIVVVGNKADLEDQREVTEKEAKDLVKTFGTIYLETSAKTRKNVDEVFSELVRLVTALRKSKEPGNNVDNKRSKKFGLKTMKNRLKPKDCSIF